MDAVPVTRMGGAAAIFVSLAVLLGSGCAHKPADGEPQASASAPSTPPTQAVPTGTPPQGASGTEQLPADPWPREISLDGTPALVYQPQVESWTDNQLAFRAAMALKPAAATAEIYGVIWGSARTHVDKGNRLVTLEELSISRIKFPTEPDNGVSYLTALRQALQRQRLRL